MEIEKVTRGLALLAVLAVPCMGDAFQNGSFESSNCGANSSFVTLPGSCTITGWTVGGAGVDYIGGYWVAQDGGLSLDLSALSSGSVSQTFDTLIGQQYLVSYWIAGNPAGGPALKNGVATAGSASQNFTFDITGHNTNNMGWEQRQFAFTANATSTTLTFASSSGDPYGPALDNVSVTASAVPEPASIGFMTVAGIAGAAMWRKRKTRA